MSIEVYNLKHPGKRDGRKQVWLDCVRTAGEFTRAYSRLLASKSGDAEESFEDACRRVRARMAPQAEYSAMARFCFRGHLRRELYDMVDH